ncbi:MAG: hypothetical protein JXR27_04465 [Paludibacteraceae bacterium]|nr:hypothetical protein [Paludibacteraceae bacterium]
MWNYRFQYYFKRVIAYLLTILILIVFTLEGSIPIFPFGAIIAIFVTAVAGIVAGVLHGREWLHPHTRRLSRRVLFVGLAVVIPSYFIYRIQISNNFKNATTLVKAVYAFQKHNGSFPTQLEELVPEFIDDVPALYLGVWPRSYDYEYIMPVSVRNDEAQLKSVKPAFYMEYRGYLGVKYTFLSHDGRWKLDD